MPAGFLDPPGESIGCDDLRVAKAQDLATRLRTGDLPFCRFLECRRVEGSDLTEAVVFEVEVEVGQRPVHDIRRRERVAATFKENDTAPEVLALRSDFPFVPHLNLRDSGEVPRSLCLYDVPYNELKLTWTSVSFIERIRQWFALTARGELHADDQPLEPLLIGSPLSLVLASDLFDEHSESPEMLMGRIVEYEGNVQAIIAEHFSKQTQQNPELRYVATRFVGKPQEHGVIRSTPTTLRELRDFLGSAGMDLFAELRGRLSSWRGNESLDGLLDMELLVVVALPKMREAAGPIEASDVWAFVCKESVGRLGERLGVWQVHDGHLAALLGYSDPELEGEDVTLIPLNVNFALSRESAAQFSGVKREDKKIVAVGVGALGSQAFGSLFRTGFGEWSLIDDDRLLPHNLAKHQLMGRDVGRPKADALIETANETIDGAPIARAVVANVLTPGQQKETIEEVLASSDVVLDASASVAVARHLARDVDSPARRVSLFFNPSGTAGVMLCEDAGRESPLDWLEMLYYRELLDDPSLHDHLRQPPGRVRYARSCRDLSATLPQDLVGLHAALGVRALRGALDEDAAEIAIWRTNSGDLGVEHLRVAPTEASEQEVGNWTVITDQRLLERVVDARLEKLPNETGGVLVGAHDMERKILYVVDALPSPPDSTEWPTLYIRGSQGLARRIEEIRRITDAQLGYVGEWHSHPRGHGPSPSPDDRKVFAWLEQHMEPDGLPAVMLIVGEETAWYVEQMP
jgi:hypothetical protein